MLNLPIRGYNSSFSAMIHRVVRLWPLTAKVQGPVEVLDVMHPAAAFAKMMLAGAEDLIVDRRYSRILIELVMAPDSQTGRPRIITNLSICAEIHGPKNMASKIFTRNLEPRIMTEGAEDLIVDRRYSRILIELVMAPDSQAGRARIITNLSICAEIHGPKNMASKIFTHHVR